jgi:hypothetical protein
MAIPEKEMAAIIKTISEAAPIEKLICTNIIRNWELGIRNLADQLLD